MYGLICKRCGRHYWSASLPGPAKRCEACGGELEPTGETGRTGPS
jgi:rRNA maturation endonuclease Nob1